MGMSHSACVLVLQKSRRTIEDIVVSIAMQRFVVFRFLS